MTTAAMVAVTHAYDQIDQARAELDNRGNSVRCGYWPEGWAMPTKCPQFTCSYRHRP
jgi:hypothetical protein